MLLVDTSAYDIVQMVGDAPSLQIAAFAVSPSTGEAIISAAREYGAQALLELPLVEETAGPVADFSGSGPTKDGRIKPDVLAPGEGVFSVRSDGDLASMQCGITIGASDLIVTSRVGTSISTPIVAAMALLVRQYFLEGFYPSGQRQQSDSMSPTAALVKAVLIHGSSRAGLETNTMHVGFGRAELKSVLFFRSQSSHMLLVYQPGSGKYLGTGSEFTQCFGLAAGASLKATLAWTDPEAALFSGLALVNDLDLSVSGPHTLLGCAFQPPIHALLASCS
jgi:hypothetical protein